MKRTLTIEDLREVGSGAFFRAKHLEEIGVNQRDLQALLLEGKIDRVTRGLYRLTDVDPTQHYTLAAVCARAPAAIVCLLTALTVHEIGTQLPHDIWIAIPQRTRTPKIREIRTRIVRFSGPSLNYGVETTQFEGVPARITNVARTLIDCFRFRRLVGLDTAKEGLRDALADRKTTVDEIWRAADVCRARSLVGPYLEVWAS